MKANQVFRAPILRLCHDGEAMLIKPGVSGLLEGVESVARGAKVWRLAAWIALTGPQGR